MERSKDTLLTARSTIRKKDSKGRDVLTLYLSPAEVTTFMQTVEQAMSVAGPAGVKFTFHTGKKEHEGRSFDSTFGFVKAVEEKGAGAGAPAGRFVPKASASVAERDAKIAGINAKKLG